MALDASVQGNTANPPLITWSKSDATTQDLTGYIITGKIYSIERRKSRVIVGSLIVVDPTNGIFRWTRLAADVEEDGMFEVQFIGTASGLVNITYSVSWQIYPAR